MILSSSSLSDEAVNRGPMTTADKDTKEAGDYVVPNVLSPIDLVFRPDLSDINCTIIKYWLKPAKESVIRISDCFDMTSAAYYLVHKLLHFWWIFRLD